mmetsp:Transcript_21655/g.63607  ORF Transcript_21655/g.63607 Transcript_21655/m.63607 type:complete len:202 (+) Transcript_21655:480-1085(+)
MSLPLSSKSMSPPSSSENSSSCISSAKWTFFAMVGSNISRTSPTFSARIRGTDADVAEVLALAAVLAALRAATLLALSRAALRRDFPLAAVIRVKPVAPVRKVRPSSESSSSDSIMSSNTVWPASPSLLPAVRRLSARSASFRMCVKSLWSVSGTRDDIFSYPKVRASLLRTILIFARNRPFPLPYFMRPPTTSGRRGSSR